MIWIQQLHVGQIFRYETEEDNSYTIILSDRVINIKQEEDTLFVKSNNYDNLEEKIYSYFDLKTDYEKINRYIINKEKSLKEVVEKSNGLKMIQQNHFETVMEYIISANNRVPAIKKSMNLLAMKYGKKINFENKEYYLFPEPKDLKNITIEELRSEMKVGFRDKYIFNAIKAINSKEFDLNLLENLNTSEALSMLMKYNGIGIKVASCILLFSYGRFDVFPIDTWVKKYMQDTYGIGDVKTIEIMAKEKYSKYSGIILQYMFHAKRNNNSWQKIKKWYYKKRRGRCLQRPKKW